jgi:EAL domain-containing protein (putative c-di-GMP-specific phosphodiesterase class I)
MTKRVLILDDEELLARMLGRVAHAAGFEATVAITPAAFAQSYETCIPDVVILDLALGQSDGIEQIHYLKDRGYKNELVLISGVDAKVLNTAANIARGQGLTVAGAMRKPIRMADLTTLLRRIDAEPETVTCDRIMAAARSHELSLELHPVVTASESRVAWIESRVRWNHPTLGTLPAGAFFPIAEKSRATVDVLTEWIVDASLAAHLALGEPGRAIPIATQLAVRNLGEPGFVDALGARLAAARLRPEALHLQFSEAGLAAAPPESADTLARLRLKGFALSLDGYGTGGTTIAQLLSLPFSELRLDRAVVARCFESKEALALVKSAVAIASAMEFVTTAAGVDTTESRNACVALGIDNVQGAVVAAPSDVDGLRGWLARPAC